jgi:hypothetical protein
VSFRRPILGRIDNATQFRREGEARIPEIVA